MSGRGTKIKTWKTLEILNLSANHLQEKGFENPRLNAEQLLAHVLNISRIELYLNFERPLSDTELTRLKSLLRRRLQHEPLQYLIGQTEFMSLPFHVDSRCLIPRPETEILVQTIFDICQSDFSAGEQIRILDIGTGSGNIAISLAHEFLNAQIEAIDSSQEALQIAQENALLNQVESQISFTNTDIYQFSAAENFNILVSNPPYISEEEFTQLPAEVKQFEPAGALFGGKDGLDFYRVIASKAFALLAPQSWVVLEIGYLQADSVTQLFSGAGFQKIQCKKDLNGLDRILVIRV